MALGGQLIAAVGQHFAATTSCGNGRWAVLSRDGEAFTSGNPAHSSAVDEIKKAHKKALAREGNVRADSVDIIEPVHVRTFFAANLSGRRLAECDPSAVMLHAAVLMGMPLLLRFDELTSLHTHHMGRSEGHLTFSIPAATKNTFKKSVYHLTPWPTSFGLDPRMDPLLALAAWMRIRGGAPGYIFCAWKNVQGRLVLYEMERLQPARLTASLRSFYSTCGVLDAAELATHTPKRSGVQLFEALEQRLVWIMDKGGWTDPASFLRYRSLCNKPEQRYAHSEPESW